MGLSAWFGRDRRTAAMARDIAELREELAATNGRLDALDGVRADVGDVRAAISRARQLAEERTATLAERMAALAGDLDQLRARLDGVDHDLDRRSTGARHDVENAVRRADERLDELRCALAEAREPVERLGTELRRLDARLRLHVEDTDRIAVALLHGMDRADR